MDKITKADIIDELEKRGIISKADADAMKKGELKLPDPGPPEVIETTSLGSSYRTFMTDACIPDRPVWAMPWGANSVTVNPYVYTDTSTYGNTIIYKDITSETFNIGVISDINKKDKSISGALYDNDPKDLCTERILTMVETMKAKLMCTVHDLRIDHFECKMTPEVRKIITRAWKKLDMYGKIPPFVPRFDEYLNELPEKFNVAGGLLVKMVDPKKYGELYFEIDAIQGDKRTIVNDLSNPNITVKRRLADEPTSLWDSDELPF